MPKTTYEQEEEFYQNMIKREGTDNITNSELHWAMKDCKDLWYSQSEVDEIKTILGKHLLYQSELISKHQSDLLQLQKEILNELHKEGFEHLQLPIIIKSVFANFLDSQSSPSIKDTDSLSKTVSKEGQDTLICPRCGIPIYKGETICWDSQNREIHSGCYYEGDKKIRQDTLKRSK